MLSKDISGAEWVIAYFSTEIDIDAAIPTYSGGLGILAGDKIRSAADFHVPMVALTIFHRKSYFYQRISTDGSQTEEPIEVVVGGFSAGDAGKGFRYDRGADCCYSSLEI